MKFEVSRVPLDMKLALKKFDAEADNLVASFISPIEAVPPPPLVYNYTNDIGLRGILESGKLWLSDIFSLNDPTELSHGFSHVIKILREKATYGLPETKLFAEHVEAVQTQGGIRAAAHYFVCSFSAAGDDLGQWRAYADNGRGYALGFNAKMLEAAYTHDGAAPITNNSTFPITYDDVKLIELHRELVDKMFPLISLPRGRGLTSAAIRDFMRELSTILSTHALRTALFFKHEAYKNETEYRFLEIHRGDRDPPKVKFRGRPDSLIKYREFDWRGTNALALEEIVIGPAANKDQAYQIATDCLKAFNCKMIEPVHSRIPYRASSSLE